MAAWRIHAAPAALGIALFVAAPVDAFAQAPAAAQTADVVSFPAAFYSESQPATALDMVSRTPGFTYNRGRNDVRGLAGALGNVLIDGQPQTSKTVTLDEALTRIPASQVARIDIVRAGAGGIDMMGFTIVANVVRSGGARTEKTVQIEPKFYADGGSPDGSARFDYSRRAGALFFSGSVALSSEKVDQGGGRGELVRISPAGAMLDGGEFVADNVDKSGALNGVVEYRTGDTLLRSNFGYTRTRTDRDESAYLATFERFIAEEDVDQGELGVNVERKFSDTLTGKIDVLQNLQQKTLLAGRLGRVAQTDADSGETNLRLTMSMRGAGPIGLEGGAEGAFNFLDQESALTAANANVRVEEKRTQPFITMNWQIAAPLSLELGARYEMSTISQSGDTNSERTFSFLKPRAVVIASILENTQLRFRFERDVKQLDFNDFAASSGATDGAGAAGNAALEPEWSWVSEVALEQRLWDRSTIVLTYTHEDVRDVWDYEAVGLTSDGKGNVGKGTRDMIVADIKIGLDRFGLEGVRIEGSPEFSWSEVVDPFTGRTRPISGGKGWRGRLGVYLDKPEINSTFGFDWAVGRREWSYRIDQTQVTAQRGFHEAFWEWTPRPTTSVQLRANYVFNRKRDRDREVYAGPRALDTLAFIEKRYVERGAKFVLRVRQSF